MLKPNPKPTQWQRQGLRNDWLMAIGVYIIVIPTCLVACISVGWLFCKLFGIE